MKYPLIDSHSHITSSILENDVLNIIERAKIENISKIINICTDVSTLEKGLKLADLYPHIYNTASTTPHDVEKEGESFFSVVERIAKEKKLVAIGETGLDYYYEHSPKEIQKKILKRYLHLAMEHQLPVVIHCREAFKDFFEILDEEYVVDNRHAKGVLHCFTGTVDEAYEVIKRGFYLSLSGIVTFKKSTVLREVAKIVPLNQLLIETDSPYLAPQSKRGKINEPSFLRETADFIAEIKGIDKKDLAKAIFDNANNLFNLPGNEL